MKRPALVAGTGMVAALAAVAIPVSIASAGTSPHPAIAARPVTAASVTAVPATTAPAAAPTTSNPTTSRSASRTFPLTPTWLPYGLQVGRSHLEAMSGPDSSGVLWITASSSDHQGPQVQISVDRGALGAQGLSSIDRWNHFTYTRTTVNGLPATLALPHAFTQDGHVIDRTGVRYLLFQHVPGQWVEVSAQQSQGVAADAGTLQRIATNLKGQPLDAPASTP